MAAYHRGKALRPRPAIGARTDPRAARRLRGTANLRIDHYLGKETSQNILFFRFANYHFRAGLGSPLCGNAQLPVAESVDIGTRAGYYDTLGVLRDIFRTTCCNCWRWWRWSAPASFEADAVRNETVKVLKSIRPIALEDTVRAQYEGYRETEGTAPDSQTPTYAALKLFIDNWRWQGVPFYLRSGKALRRKISEIIIEFQRPPHLMFRLPPGADFSPNLLALTIQPDEGIHLRFQAKVPDSDQDMRPVDMDFHYRDSFTDRSIPEAYERLLLKRWMACAAVHARTGLKHRGC